MNLQLTPARSSLAGAAVMAACACGAGNSSAKLITMAGLPATAKLTHPVFLAVGALLIFTGLLQMNRRAAAISVAGFAMLIAGSILTPPMMMSVANTPWQMPQMIGALFYLLFGAALGYAFWLAFPSPMPGAAATGIAGTVAATGCNCCMVTGAIAGMMVTAGGSKDVFLRNPTVFFSGIAVAAVGLAMIRSWRPLPWLLAGAVVTRWGGEALKLTGDWVVGTVNLRFIPGYIIYLIGAGLVMTAWAVAYEPTRVRPSEEPAEMPGEPVLQRS
ncbi:MAG TPA: hypothetical protein VFL80_09395 [Thermoanaerobaculia bacterium]|nr:hypothetical protein [Thermoanaerobaculia bacterium]